MQMSKPLFPEYEAVVDRFHRDAGGVIVTAIRSPRKILDEFRAAFPDETARDLRYLGAPIELADGQDFVQCAAPTLPVKSSVPRAWLLIKIYLFFPFIGSAPSRRTLGEWRGVLTLVGGFALFPAYVTWGIFPLQRLTAYLPR